MRCGLACFGCSRAAYSPSCFNSAQVRLSGSVANTPHTQNDRSIFTATRSCDSDAASPDIHHTSTPPTGTNEAHLPSLRPDHETHFHFTLPSTATLRDMAPSTFASAAANGPHSASARDGGSEWSVSLACVA